MIGFYLLAIALAGGLLYVPYAEMHYTNRFTLRLALFCVVGALVILKAIVPRIDRFDPPGVELQAADQPRLFALLTEVAGATGQRMPASVYAIADLNAWVSQRGGFMGLGSRRVMAIGLPLLQTLSEAECRGVIAHEFGHYHGGDTALGPWVYKTREAIERTLRQLSSHSAALTKPFLWYGKAFLRVTHAISRQQEYAADALAARIVGVGPMATGLRALHAGGAAFDGYWRTELSPAVNAGFKPPVIDGFRRFLAEPGVADATDAAMTEALNGAADPYDTHPSLRERLEALGAPATSNGARTDAPALTLLDGVDALDATLLDGLARRQKKTLAPIAWRDVGERVWLPEWRRLAAAKAGRLRGLTPAALGQPGFNFAGLGEHLAGIRPGETDAARLRQVVVTLGATLAAGLHARGWTLDALPGRIATFTRDGVILAPFDAVERLATGTMPPEAWAAWCAAAEVADVELSTLVR
jgi:Zn-dependent protease with chaperone function